MQEKESDFHFRILDRQTRKSKLNSQIEFASKPNQFWAFRYFKIVECKFVSC